MVERPGYDERAYQRRPPGGVGSGGSGRRSVGDASFGRAISEHRDLITRIEVLDLQGNDLIRSRSRLTVLMMPNLSAIRLDWPGRSRSGSLVR